MSLRYVITQLGLQNMKGSNNSSVKQMKSNITKFCDWCKVNGYNKLSKIEKAGKAEVLQEYCNYLVNRKLSPATVHTYVSAPCTALDIRMDEIEKPRRTSDTISRSRDVLCNVQGKKERYEERYNRIISFQSVVGIRRSELGKLQGKNLVYDESGKLCIEVVSGKGGKHQLQRVLSENVEIVKKTFQGIGTEEYVFSSTELRNKLDFHKMRAENARNAYEYYKSLDHKEKKELVKEMKARWLVEHPQYDANSVAYKKWLAQLTKSNGLYKLRGNNYDRALVSGKPLCYERIPLMAVSMFHLAHYRLNVAVINYML